MHRLHRIAFIFIFCLIATHGPAGAQDDGNNLTPGEFAAEHGITWPSPLPDADSRHETLSHLLNENTLELYKSDGFDDATCTSLLDKATAGEMHIHAPISTAPDINTLWEQAGITHCPQNNPLLNPGREWTILTKYYKQVIAIPDWRDWPTDKATLYEAQFNLGLYSPYPHDSAEQGPDLLFFAEGICRPSDGFTCLSPRYKLFNPAECDFHYNFMVDARYTPGDKKLRTAHNGVVDIAGNTFIYDFVADSAPDATAPVKNGRFRLREIHRDDAGLSKRSCQYGTPDYVTIWKRYH